jgi:hypothetical protein
MNDKPTEEPALTAWPPVAPQRLAFICEQLAARVDSPELAAQLNALAVLVAHLGSETSEATERRRLLDRYERESGHDQAAALHTLRELARLDRAAVGRVDWSAVSGA